MKTIAPLPTGWIQMPLGNCGTWYGGGTPSKFNDSYWKNGTIPWISPKDMKTFRIRDSEDHLAQLAIEETNVKPFPSGTVLVVIRSGILSRTLPVAVSQILGTMNQDLKGLLPSEGIDSEFVAYFLQAYEQDILRKCSKHGTTVASIDTASLHSYPLSIAPLNEQRRIVAKIEELFSDLDAGVAALKRAKANLKRYRAAVLKAAVEGKLTEEWRAKHPAKEPASALLARILKERRRKWEADQLAKFAAAGKEPSKNWQDKYIEPTPPDTSNLPEVPNGWCWATLPQLGFLDRGRSRNRPRNAPHLYGGPYPFVQTGDIRHADTYIRAYDQTYSEAGLEQSKLWPAGTLCITIAANIAETAILGFDGCFPDSVVGFIPISEDISVRFVELFFRTIQERLEAFAPATAQKNLNLESLNQVAVCLPPASEQLQIVAEIDERLSLVRAAEASIEANSKRAARLRQSILKQAFEGKLVPQDPSDEPASVLLERLQANRSATADLRTPKTQVRPTERRLREVPNQNGSGIS